MVILLAEDNPANRKVAELQLKRLSYGVMSVQNGRECVTEFMRKRDEYTAILMDCNMPVMDGFAATQEIRRIQSAEEGDNHIVIIAMTANVMEGDRELCLAAGMDDYLPKPVSQDALRQMLGKWIK